MTTEVVDLEARMGDLVKSFPSVVGAPGALRWDANLFDRWAADSAISHGELVTAKFLLAVWDSDHDWRCGRFDVMGAMRVWDARHREAFLRWAGRPWWA